MYGRDGDRDAKEACNGSDDSRLEHAVTKRLHGHRTPFAANHMNLNTAVIRLAASTRTARAFRV